MGISVAQFEDIKQKISQGLSDRQIAKSLGRRRTTVSEIRKGQYKHETVERLPSWMNCLNWEEILKDIGLKHPLKFIWEESAKELTSYTNFLKYLYKKFPYLRIEEYTHRQFNPGDRVEVDWAGDEVEWIDPITAEVNKCYIFVGCLGYSQLVFARAFSSMREIDFLTAHEGMFNFYGGVPDVICPDNTKTAVIKANRYDPDLNEEYNRFTKHFGITVAPARVYSPKDKALVEGSVKLIQRYFRFKNRQTTFTSLSSINISLKEICDTINNKPHTRFKISRREMFDLEEAKKLKPLPATRYELCETKFCKVHPDGTVQVNLRYYSTPYPLVGRSVFVRIYANTVEIYHDLKKVAVHVRLKGHKGQRSILSEHTPEASQAYRNTTVQFVIQQALLIDPLFKSFIERILLESPCGNLRKAQGFLREARATKGKISTEIFREIMKRALTDLERFGEPRVERFKNFLKLYLDEFIDKAPGDQIRRDPSNPMLRRNQTLH